MNIEGNKVIFEKGDVAVADTARGFVVYKHLTTRNGDGTAFRSWVDVETFEDSEEAIKYVENGGC